MLGAAAAFLATAVAVAGAFARPASAQSLEVGQAVVLSDVLFTDDVLLRIDVDSGALLDTIVLPSGMQPRAVALDANADAFVLRALIRVDLIAGTIPFGPVALPSLPGSLAFEATGNLIVPNGASDVLRVDPGTGDATVVTSDLPMVPSGVAVERDGQILVIGGSPVSTPGGKLVRVDPLTGAQTVLASATPFSRPVDLALEEDGGILVLDLKAYGGTGGIIRVHPTTASKKKVSSGGFFQGDNSLGRGGIAVEASGDILVAAASGKLFRVDPIDGTQSLVHEGAPGAFTSIAIVRCLSDADCDDDNVCTADACAPLPDAGTDGCVHTPVITCAPCEACDPINGTCDVGPRPGCRASTVPKGLLLLRDRTPDAADRIVWKWIKGERTDPEDFGDPLTTSDYGICVYDSSAGAPPTSLILGATAPAGGTCAGQACWRALGSPAGSRGYRYKDRERTPDGVDFLLVKPGDDGKAKIVMRGAGGSLGMPSPLNVALPATVQLHSRNECWTATYDTPVRNETGFFKAKPSSPSGAFVDSIEGLLP